MKTKVIEITIKDFEGMNKEELMEQLELCMLRISKCTDMTDEKQLDEFIKLSCEMKELFNLLESLLAK